MNIIGAVAYDLYLFVFRYRFGFNQHQVVHESNNKKEVLTTSGQLTQDQVTKFTTKLATAVSAVDASVPAAQTLPITESTTRAYIQTDQAELHVLPTRTIDGVIMLLDYTKPVEIINKQGNWYQVHVGECRGWIERDVVNESLASMLPRFSPQVVYDAAHASTLALRILIHDQFNTRIVEAPLQDVEYVTYVLQQKNRFISWGQERPRIAGTWQRLLRGKLGIHVGIQPRTESIMECVYEDNTGHVAFVESVFPDGSITLSEIGYLSEGLYTERTLSRDEWKELRPVFIDVA